MERPALHPEFTNFKAPEVTDDILSRHIAKYEYEQTLVDVDPCYYCTITLRNGFMVQGSYRPELNQKVELSLANRQARADAQAQVIRLLQYVLYDGAYWMYQEARASAGLSYDHPVKGPTFPHVPDESNDNADILPPMKRVESSNIEALGWSSGYGLLVQFKGKDGPGARWRYPSVPEELYRRMVTAPSVGKFYIAEVQKKFEGDKLEKE